MFYVGIIPDDYMRFLCLIFAVLYVDYAISKDYYLDLNPQEQDKLAITLTKISTFKKALKDLCAIKTGFDFGAKPDNDLCIINSNTSKTSKAKNTIKKRIKENLLAIKNCKKTRAQELSFIKEQIKNLDSACLLGASKSTAKLSSDDLKMKPILLTIDNLNTSNKATLKQNLMSKACTQVLNN